MASRATQQGLMDENVAIETIDLFAEFADHDIRILQVWSQLFAAPVAIELDILTRIISQVLPNA